MKAKQNGGARPGAGRPKGRLSSKTLKIKAASEKAFRDALKARGDAKLTSLALLQTVYESDKMPMDVRIYCAEKALPYEHPKLQSVEMTGAGGVPLAPPIINVNFVRPGAAS